MTIADHRLLEPDYRPMIRDLPEGERPRERLRSRGASALSNAELLAILMRTGNSSESVLDMAAKLLAHFGGLDRLARATHGDLCEIHGFGEAKAAQVLAAAELGRRLVMARGEERPTINSPGDVAALLMPEMAALDKEHLHVLTLDRKNRVMESERLSMGSAKSTQVRAAEVFRTAVKQNYPGVIVVHNHPSGDPEPSVQDVAVTYGLVQAGLTLDIELLDHVVVARDGFVSMKDRGMGFRKSEAG